MIEQIKNGVITIKQKKKFFQYALDIYTKNSISSGNGFCYLYQSFFYNNKNDYFGANTNNFELLPELRRHKPKKIFYNHKNEETDEKSQFWFPLGENEKRIKICKKILISLPKTLNTICPDCYGKGEIETSHEFKHCKTCNGSGKVKLK